MRRPCQDARPYEVRWPGAAKRADRSWSERGTVGSSHPTSWWESLPPSRAAPRTVIRLSMKAEMPGALSLAGFYLVDQV